MSSNILVLYHAECNDGFGAGFAAWKKFGGSATYIPVYHDNPPPNKAFKAEKLYILDFCYDEKTMENLHRSVKEITVLDHHISSSYISQKYGIFDNNHSGAIIAWHYFHPNEPALSLLNYIEDIDLWKKVIPYSDEINSALSIYPMNFNIWSKIMDERQLDVLKQEGVIIIKYKNVLIETTVRNAYLINLNGISLLAANSIPEITSEVGNYLSKKARGSLTYYIRKNKVICSIHSDKQNKDALNCAEFALKMGGGGHEHAAGFSLALKDIGLVLGIKK